LTALLCENRRDAGLVRQRPAAANTLKNVCAPPFPDLPEETLVREGFDFAEIAEAAPEFETGFSSSASQQGLFGCAQVERAADPRRLSDSRPHRRPSACCILAIAVRRNWFDASYNALLEVKQETSPIGYSYL